ncbi:MULTISPECIES: ABC transporter permease [Arthrobacter]|uniref:ABC transporter permease n=1 Tax=Arthrobacter jinronghuae TaxID=2964609 RepID=A0ABT1NKT7_9MICC|nr:MULTISPECIES: ABC transporter permease [Arthrobacter]MCQ1948336.1 ABC transporter permease [Arthrobacter jinronghuae]MCQ1951661.1 ABC transporter permease [Arthrobacter sp. zg-Y238]MCQ1956215.1 ABC transporter permease [Arthrobacter jinronghuae]UWX78824.1 ABC transporter permease [Arthrobacter jinronghuae]
MSAPASSAAATRTGGTPARGTLKAPAGRAGGWLDQRLARLGLGLLVPVLLLAAWQLTSTAGVFSAVQLPSPGAVYNAAADLVQRGQLGTHIAISTQRVLTGFAIGSALGLVLGALLGLSRLADALLGPVIGALRAVPSLAWVPLLILWMKIGEDSKITLITIGAFFPVFTTVALALRHVDRNLVEAARAFGLRGVKLLTTVQLPAVVPAVCSGLRLALAQSWLFLVAAELIASSMGLGFLLMDSQNNGRTDRMFLAIITLAVFGKATDALLGIAEKWAVKKWA